MKFEGDLLPSQARGIPQVTPDVGDSTLLIPNVVQPTIELVRPAQPATVFAGQNSSFFIVFAAQSRNAAAATTNGPIFQKGRWRLTLQLMFLSNWDNSASNTPQAVLQLSDGSQAAGLASFHTGLATFVHLAYSTRLDLLIPTDGWILQWFIQTTGVGQISIAEVGVLANKMS